MTLVGKAITWLNCNRSLEHGSNEDAGTRVWLPEVSGSCVGLVVTCVRAKQYHSRDVDVLRRCPFNAVMDRYVLLETSQERRD